MFIDFVQFCDIRLSSYSYSELFTLFSKRKFIMCIERLPPSSFMGSTGNFTAADVQVDPDIDTDFDDYDIDSYDPEYAITDQSSEWTDYLWMENEQEFEQEEIRRLEEEELANQCLEAMGELVLLDEIRQVEAEQHNVKE